METASIRKNNRPTLADGVGEIGGSCHDIAAEGNWLQKLWLLLRLGLAELRLDYINL